MTVSLEYYKKAINEISTILGNNLVITDQDTLKRFQQTTFNHNNRIPAVVIPKTKKHIQKTLHIASKYQISIYPVSAGKNWGYGSYVPSKNLCILVDLSLLKKITNYDKTLGTISVEAGVTFKELNSFLEKENSSFFCGAPATIPDASVVGNLLERGIGVGRVTNRVESISNMELLLANGLFVNTGLERYSNTFSKGACKYALGPDLTGLFIQSNFGIIINVTIQLDRIPNEFQTLKFSFNNKNFAIVIDNIRKLYMEDILTTNLIIGNNYRVLSGYGNTSSPNQTISDWSASGAIFSPSVQHGKVSKKLIKNRLTENVNNITFMGSVKANYILKFKKILPSSWQHFAEQHVNSKYLGKTKSRSLKMVCYKKKLSLPKNEPIDPDKNHCGLRWYSTIAPLIGGKLELALSEFKDILIGFSIEPNIGLNIISKREAYITIAILFDQEDDYQDKNAASCYDSLILKGVDIGLYPARLILGNGNEFISEDQTLSFIKSLKTFIDPGNIISPNRYI